MAEEQNQEIARRAYRAASEGFRSGDFSGLDEVIAPDVRDHDPDPGQGEGREGLKAFFAELARAFPGLEVVVDDLIAEGDRVAARVRFRGTHSGDFQGIAASGRPVEMRVVDVLRIRDGKIVERWGVGDQLGLMQQLGAVPA
ncbi:MAG TPA: ester cyclase [Longimicrobiaceae bacterium]|nr:ester cyclase [Longimicrobiaceae bacterium]